MDVGIGLPSTIPGVERDHVLEWARRAEARGFSCLGTIDRIVYDNYEPLIALAAAAAVTERIRLATSILIAPYGANGALVAKQAASVDRISNGRLARRRRRRPAGRLRGRRRRLPHAREDASSEMLAQWRRIWAASRSGTPARSDRGPGTSDRRLVLGGTAPT